MKEIDLAYDPAETWGSSCPTKCESEEEPKKAFPKLCLYGEELADLPDEGTATIRFRKVVADVSGEIPRYELEVHSISDPKNVEMEMDESEDSSDRVDILIADLGKPRKK